MRRKKKKHLLTLSLVAILAFLLTIWLINPGVFDVGKNQKNESISQMDPGDSTSNEPKTKAAKVEEETTTGVEKDHNEVSLGMVYNN